VTLKIETIRDDEGTSIKLIGRLRAESLPELKAEIKASGTVIALEMDEVTLVDLDVVRFLSTCETQGIELRGCPPYIRQWIAQERESETR
jgi:anti-anti-sigma regulatory factor